jgi:hypothetical protein
VISISLYQPWAALWLSPAKIHETRSWRTKHRGWLAVHATQHIPNDTEPAVEGVALRLFGPKWRRDLPRGAVLGAVELEDIVPAGEILRNSTHYDDLACGDFTGIRFAWRRGRFVLLPDPVAYPGHRMLWNIDSKFINDALAELIARVA